MPNVVAKLEITMTDTGQVSIVGPIENQLLAYGMLEIARNLVYDTNKKREESRIVQPVFGGPMSAKA